MLLLSENQFNFAEQQSSLCKYCERCLSTLRRDSLVHTKSLCLIPVSDLMYWHKKGKQAPVTLVVLESRTPGFRRALSK